MRIKNGLTVELKVNTGLKFHHFLHEAMSNPRLKLGVGLLKNLSFKLILLEGGIYFAPSMCRWMV